MTSTLENEMPPRIYQFYKLASTPVYSTVSMPVVSTGLALGTPQFGSYTLI